MCGLAGRVFVAGGDSTSLPLIERITRSQRSRGPDHQAIESLASPGLGAVFGHNRLAIIDLSTEANQPMWDSDRRLCLIYNGEVYNYLELRAELEQLGHSFSTRSDTEVVLEAYRAWGDEAFKRFNGPFAIAIFDLRAERLTLARDRFGVKPLYYFADKTSVVFASTPALISKELGLLPSLDYATFGLRFGVYDDAAGSPFVGLLSVEPGTALAFQLSAHGDLRLSRNRYYDLESRVASMVDSLRGESDSDLKCHLRDLLRDAIRIRFRADVPVAISLSGGLDSASVAALASTEVGELVGYTFGHPSDGSSEGPVVQALAGSTHMSVQYVTPDIKSIESAYLDVLSAQGAPFAGASVIAQYLVYERVKQRGVRVLLGGQGGDELFMGYRKYHLFRVQELIARGEYAKAIAFAPSLARMILAEFPQARTYWRARNRYRQGAEARAQIFRPTVPGPSPLTLARNEQLRHRQIRDICFASLPSLLRYEDRNSMAHSVESRLPYLDYRLVEFALAVPTSLKLRNGYGKWILREAVKGTVPDGIRLSRRKRGFDVQQDLWIRAGLGSVIRNALEQRQERVREWTNGTGSIEESFSDRQLIDRPAAFGEATSLIWLADNTR